MTTPSDNSYPLPVSKPLVLREQDIEAAFIAKLRSLKYSYRPDIRDPAALERNFRQKFEALNRVRLTDGEFQRLLDELITPDVFTASRVLREKNDFTRDDGTPLSYTLVNIRDWCKNDYEVVHQLRINTDYSHHRYDVILLINGVPVAQVELKTLGVSPHRAMEQVVEYKNDPGNGYSRTLLCFIQLFIVSNRAEQGKTGKTPDNAVDQIDFEFVLFASADIDYDYIMALITRYANQTPGKLTLTRDQLVGLIRGEAKLMDDGRIIVDYIDSLGAVKGVSEEEIRAGYRRFRDERHAAELAAVAQKHALAPDRLQTFVENILQRMVFDGEQLTELLEPLGLAWKDRRLAELALMTDLVPLLKKRAAGRDISGLSAYE